MADDFSERDDAIGDQFRVLDAFRDRFAKSLPNERI